MAINKKNEKEKKRKEKSRRFFRSANLFYIYTVVLYYYCTATDGPAAVGPVKRVRAFRLGRAPRRDPKTSIFTVSVAGKCRDRFGSRRCVTTDPSRFSRRVVPSSNSRFRANAFVRDDTLRKTDDSTIRRREVSTRDGGHYFFSFSILVAR